MSFSILAVMVARFNTRREQFPYGPEATSPGLRVLDCVPVEGAAVKAVPGADLSLN